MPFLSIPSFAIRLHAKHGANGGQKNIERLGIYQKQKFKGIPIIGREEYLKYHRNKIFFHA